ncbi:hypothetical protein B0T10DRAFT_543111 [Thelonectria olida]|uniref:Transcription factor domain-containing protein n=1 Tax=Thelonectria olida TaxID=1576542 RepID=A0A9P8WFW3_9HYPO|nr:hypothetical protein B0T10DRAFT_543111 [Thelonectria olida]
MAPQTINLDRTFINVYDDPAEGRDARRTRVRSAVMSDYHKRRKRSRRGHQVCHDQSSTQVPNLPESEQGGQEPLAPTIPNELCNRLHDPSPSPLLTQLEPRSVALFQQKTWGSCENARTSTFLIRFLCGQTRKATQDMSCVSFIHRQLKNADTQVEQRPNSLKICEENLRNFENRAMSAVTFWERVHKEQHRIYAEHQEFSKWELLSASQAVMLYILQWLRNGPMLTKFSCGNIALLFTLGKVFLTLRQRHLHFDPSDSTERPTDDWQNWVYQESSLRTANMYFILTIVLTMNFGLSCDWQVQDMPLPASKVLWEARDDLSWERSLSSTCDRARGPSFGDLLGARNSNGILDKVSHWEEGVDEMGLICAMAGRLLLE